MDTLDISAIMADAFSGILDNVISMFISMIPSLMPIIGIIAGIIICVKLLEVLLLGRSGNGSSDTPEISDPYNDDYETFEDSMDNYNWEYTSINWNDYDYSDKDDEYVENNYSLD